MRYTISLLVNYTGNPELRSFCYSMLRPNNACRNIEYFLFIRERKNLQYEGNGYLQKICRSCKKLTNYEHLALSKTKKANPSCFWASLALCTLLLPWQTHRIHGAN